MVSKTQVEPVHNKGAQQSGKERKERAQVYEEKNSNECSSTHGKKDFKWFPYLKDEEKMVCIICSTPEIGRQGPFVENSTSFHRELLKTTDFPSVTCDAKSD